MLRLLMIALVLVLSAFVPGTTVVEGTMKGTTTLGLARLTIGRATVRVTLHPYRPNRVYYRLAVT